MRRQRYIHRYTTATTTATTLQEPNCNARRDDLIRRLSAECLYHLIDNHMGWEAWATHISPAQLATVYHTDNQLFNRRFVPAAHLLQTEVHLYGSARLGMDLLNRNAAADDFTEVENPFRPSTWVPLPTTPNAGNPDTPPETPLDDQRTLRFSLGKKRYEITNHLGNVLATLSDRKSAIFVGGEFHYWQADVLSTSDYYPFGMTMEGREYSSGEYRYGFNGKENDREWGNNVIQDYGFRLYSPSLGKFLSVDPLTHDYPWYTPYQFAGNTPIQAIYLDGLEEYFVKHLQFTEEGTIVKTVNHSYERSPYQRNELGDGTLHTFHTIDEKGSWAQTQAPVYQDALPTVSITPPPASTSRFELSELAKGFKELNDNPAFLVVKLELAVIGAFTAGSALLVGNLSGFGTVANTISLANNSANIVLNATKIGLEVAGESEAADSLPSNLFLEGAGEILKPEDE